MVARGRDIRDIDAMAIYRTSALRVVTIRNRWLNVRSGGFGCRISWWRKRRSLVLTTPARPIYFNAII
jgi:hypothetical protein